MNAKLTACCGTLLLCLGGLSLAAPAAIPTSLSTIAAEDARVDGVIRSVDFENNRFVLMVDDKPMSFKISDKTAYTVDGKTASREEALKVGAKATVSHDESQVSRVDVTTT